MKWWRHFSVISSRGGGKEGERSGGAGDADSSRKSKERNRERVGAVVRAHWLLHCGSSSEHNEAFRATSFFRGGRQSWRRSSESAALFGRAVTCVGGVSRKARLPLCVSCCALRGSGPLTHLLRRSLGPLLLLLLLRGCCCFGSPST